MGLIDLTFSNLSNSLKDDPKYRPIFSHRQ